MKKSIITALIVALLAVTLTACSSETVYYTVTFDSNGGSAVEAITVKEGESITLPTTTSDGEVFLGWFIGDSIDEEPLVSPYTPTSDIEVYARWFDAPLADSYFNFTQVTVDGVSGYEISENPQSESPTDGRYILPDTHEGLPVVSVAEDGFRNIKSEVVYIPKTVKRIGNGAFRNVATLEHAIIYAESIGDYAFADCDLFSMWTMRNVTAIGVGAFANCGLTSVVIPISVTTIESGAFSGCNALADVWCQATEKPSGWNIGSEWNNATVHWGGTWETVDGEPVAKVATA